MIVISTNNLLFFKAPIFRAGLFFGAVPGVEVCMLTGSAIDVYVQEKNKTSQGVSERWVVGFACVEYLGSS